MSGASQVLAVSPPVSAQGSSRPPGHRRLRSADFRWAIAFILPYAAVFVAFVVYPYGYAVWLASKPSLYGELFADDLYLPTVINTLLFVGLGVNVKMFLALLLSGFFMRRVWYIRAVLVLYILPWAIAAAQAGVSFHWMLIDERGLVDGILRAMFGIDGPLWLNSRWLGLGSDIVAYIWKWMPFWTVVFLAARMRIPRDVYDAAELDGATSYSRFIHITVPLLANLYLICTLLSTLWALGDFTTVYMVSGGAPAGATEVLATLGFRYAFGMARPALGVAAVMLALPLLIPIVIVLMRRLQVSEVQL